MGLLDEAVEHAPVGVFVFDEEGRQHAARLSGRTVLPLFCIGPPRGAIERDLSEQPRRLPHEAACGRLSSRS